MGDQPQVLPTAHPASHCTSAEAQTAPMNTADDLIQRIKFHELGVAEDRVEAYRASLEKEKESLDSRKTELDAEHLKLRTLVDDFDLENEAFKRFKKSVREDLLALREEKKEFHRQQALFAAEKEAHAADRGVLEYQEKRFQRNQEEFEREKTAFERSKIAEEMRSPSTTVQHLERPRQRSGYVLPHLRQKSGYVPPHLRQSTASPSCESSSRNIPVSVVDGSNGSLDGHVPMREPTQASSSGDPRGNEPVQMMSRPIVRGRYLPPSMR